MNPIVVKEKIRIEQHKFEIVYLKNLWTVILSLAGFVVVLLQLFFGSNVTFNGQKAIFGLIVLVIIVIFIQVLYYVRGRDDYIKKLDAMMRQLEQYYDQNRGKN